MTALPDSYRRDLENLDEDSDSDSDENLDADVDADLEAEGRRQVQEQGGEKQATNNVKGSIDDVAASAKEPGKSVGEEAGQSSQEPHKRTDLAKARKGIHSLKNRADFISVTKRVNEMEASNFNSCTHKNVYDLVLETNALIFDIDRKMFEIYRLVVDLYSKKFPELPSLIQDSFQYINAVKLIGNKTELSGINFKNVLPKSSEMTINMTDMKGTMLTKEELKVVLLACDEVIHLNDTKTKQLLPFVSSQIEKIAPNVSALVGPEIAALLLGISGGLEALSKIPAGNIMLLGKSDAMVAGFSKTSAMMHTGVIYHCALVQNTEHSHRRKAMRTVSGRLALCARLDLSISTASTSFLTLPTAIAHQDGGMGKKWREEIKRKSETWAMPNPGKTKQALPNPEPKQRTKRAGRRMRKRKEMLAQSEMHKQMNRVSFAENDDEYGESAMGHDLGMLGSSAGNKHNKFGKLRVVVKERKHQAKLAKYEQDARNGKVNLTQKYKEQLKGINANNSGTITSGFASSVAMTPVQGIELVNPDLNKQRLKDANEKWFGKTFKFDSGKLLASSTVDHVPKKRKKA